MDEIKAQILNLWEAKVDVEQSLQLEETLRKAIKTAEFTCSKHDFETILKNQISQHRGIVDEYFQLKKHEKKLRQKLDSLEKQDFQSVQEECEGLQNDINQLKDEVEKLNDMLSSKNDIEYHQMLAQKQHEMLLKLQDN